MSQQGITLIELLLATAISAILLASINGLVKLGLDAQAAGRGSNELGYQARFALERIADKARVMAPKELATPTAGTTGNWFAPAGCVGATCVMFCRNTAGQLIETTTADTGCIGTTVIASNVTAFSAQLPTGQGPVDHPLAVLSLSLGDASGSVRTLATHIRLGGGTQ